MRRVPPYWGLTCITIAIFAGLALHEVAHESGRADDVKPPGPKTNRAAQPAKKGVAPQNKSTRKKSSLDIAALRAERALARRAAIAHEDTNGPGSDESGYAGAGGRSNNNSFGGSAYGGSSIGSGAGSYSGSAFGGSQGLGSSSGTGTAKGATAGTASAGTAAQSSASGSAATGGQSQTGSGSAALPALNQKVLDFAVSNLGKQVGSGECWELGSQALAAAGAEPPRGNVFGDAVPLTSLLPGDILEFKNAYFAGANYWLSLGSPYHTAIVSGVQGNSVAMLNQNINNVKLVEITVIHLADLRSGTITVYRPAARQ